MSNSFFERMIFRESTEEPPDVRSTSIIMTGIYHYNCASSVPAPWIRSSNLHLATCSARSAASNNCTCVNAHHRVLFRARSLSMCIACASCVARCKTLHQIRDAEVERISLDRQARRSLHKEQCMSQDIDLRCTYDK